MGWLTVIPYLCGAIAMIIWAKFVNKSTNRIPLIAGALIVASVTLAISAFVSIPALKLALLCLTVSGILSFQATYWAIPSSFLTGTAAAGGLALIVSVGNLGGFVEPFMIGYLKDMSGGFIIPLLAISVVLLIGSVVLMLLGDPGKGVDENN